MADATAGGTFGERLRALRERAGLTRDELGKAAELHRQAIVKLERGEREPAWSTVLKLADALGCEIGEFAPHNSSQRA